VQADKGIAFVNKALELIGGGVAFADLAAWDTIPYCSEQLCLRQEVRTSAAFYPLEFPARFVRRLGHGRWRLG